MSLYHLTPPFYETRYHLFTLIIFSTVSLLFKYWFWFNHKNRSDYYCKVVLKIFRILIFTWMPHCHMKLEKHNTMTRDNSKCKYLCCWQCSQRYTKSNILCCASKNVFSSFSSFWTHRLPNNVRLMCNNINDNRQKRCKRLYMCSSFSLTLTYRKVF